MECRERWSAFARYVDRSNLAGQTADLDAPLTGTSVSYAGVPSGTYYLQLTASNDAGTSGPSPQVPVTVP
jgi:hypothetical protein